MPTNVLDHNKSSKTSSCSWLYLSEWTLLLGAVYSLLRVLGFDTFADTFNSALLHPVSTFSAIERTTVLLLGNGLLRNYRFDDDSFTDIGLLAFITLYSLVEAKIAKVPVSQLTRQLFDGIWDYVFCWYYVLPGKAKNMALRLYGVRWSGQFSFCHVWFEIFYYFLWVLFIFKP